MEARSRSGAVLTGDKGSWQFTTADNEKSHELQFAFDLSDKPVSWRGGFFTGFCKPSFCTSASQSHPRLRIDAEHPTRLAVRWSLQRDFSPTSTGHQPEFLDGSHPNVVRERETRRIVSIEPQDGGVLLRVEDFFGHEQYGIPSGRALADDYHAGDEILIADGVHDARAKVLRIVADSPELRTLLVSSFETPADGWKIDVFSPLADQGRSPRAGPVPHRGMLSAKAPPRRHSALLLGPLGQGMGYRRAAVRSSNCGELHRRTG